MSRLQTVQTLGVGLREAEKSKVKLPIPPKRAVPAAMSSSLASSIAAARCQPAGPRVLSHHRAPPSVVSATLVTVRRNPSGPSFAARAPSRCAGRAARVQFDFLLSSLEIQSEGAPIDGN